MEEKTYQEGIADGKMLVAKNMLASGAFTMQEIAALCDLPLDECFKIADGDEKPEE